MTIESLQNDKIKHLVRLTNDNRFRKKSNVFIVEGQQENQRAMDFNYDAVEYFICPTYYDKELPSRKIHFVSEKVYEKVAYRGTSEGIIGIYKVQDKKLNQHRPQKNSSIIIVEGVEKPGNLGAILRSCEAFGIDALIITDPKLDIYNPNVIRSSVGCFFGMNLYQATNTETFDFLKNNHYEIYTTFMDETSVPVQKRNFKGKAAMLFGTEHSGLSDFWLGKGKNTLIPMIGTIDSLNLSNAVAITCYEILRQKQS